MGYSITPIVVFVSISILIALVHAESIASGKSPNKPLWWFIRFALVCFFTAIDQRPWLYVLATFAIINWTTHDYGINFFRQRISPPDRYIPIWWLNNTGWIDRFQRSHGGMYPWFIWKLILSFGLGGAYIFNF
jgi:hypothetical protein